MNKLIIGVCGRAYSGKTTAANALLDMGFFRFAFGDPLKQMCINAGLLTYEECYTVKTEYSRDILQKVGTGIFRNQVDGDFWLKKWYEKIQEMPVNIKIVVDDIRFPNEAQVIRDYNGIIIKTICDDNPAMLNMTDEQRNHPSETNVDLIEADYIIDLPFGNVKAIQDMAVYIANHRIEELDNI